MKKIYLLAAAALLSLTGTAQTGAVGVGTTTPDSTAQLDVSSTTKGLLIPRMTAAQRVAIQSPATGLQVYQLDGTPGILFFDGVRWIHQAYGVPVDSAGSIDLDIRVSTLAGSSTSGVANGTGAAAQFNNPAGVAVDGSGNVYVADRYNHRIRKVTPAGVVTTLAGSGTAGPADGTGAAAQFNYPAGVAVDGSGNVYVADQSNHRIRKVTPAGVVTTLAGSSTFGPADGTGAAAQFFYPTGVAVDGSGNVYVADQYNHRIRKVTPAAVVTTLAGNGAPGPADGTGAAAQFNNPTGVAVDGTGNVYVADYINDRIRKVTPAGVVTTLAGSTTGFADGTGAAAKFYSPYSVAVDGAGNVYVADRDTRRIRRVTPAGAVTTLAGSTQGFADGAGTAAKFYSPYSVAVDGAGNVYVADYSNQRIRKVSVPLYATTASLSNYATNASLSSYATNASLSNYATTASLSNYATTASLSDYVSTSGAQTVGGAKTFSDNVLASSNVGIGIAGPLSPLHVSGASQIMTRVESSAPIGTWSRLTNTSTGGGGWDMISTGSANGEGAGKLLIRSASAGTTAATFQSNGNVGIGTSNAVARLTLNGGGGDAFAIQSGGDVRIWNDNNTGNTVFYAAGGSTAGGSTLLLQSDGKTFSFNGTGGSVSSDRRLKQDITPLEHSLEKVLRLNGYTYRFKTKADVAQKEVGVIAQEVQAVLPEAVSENADGTLAVSYNSLVPLLINAVKEQQEKIAAQQAQMDAQRLRIDELEAKEAAYAEMASQLKEVRQMLGMQPKKAGAKVGRR